VSAPTSRVMSIEDDPHDRLLLSRSVEKCGIDCELDFMHDGEQARNHLVALSRGSGDDRWPDLILLDLTLPVFDGWALLSWIRSEPSLRHLVVIILSTSKDERDVRWCHRNGASCYLVKPSSLEAFDDMVCRIDRFWLQTARLPTKGELDDGARR